MFLNRRDLTPILTDSRPRAVTKLGLEFVPHIPLARHHLNRVPTAIMFGPHQQHLHCHPRSTVVFAEVVCSASHATTS